MLESSKQQSRMVNTGYFKAIMFLRSLEMISKHCLKSQHSSRRPDESPLLLQDSYTSKATGGSILRVALYVRHVGFTLPLKLKQACTLREVSINITTTHMLMAPASSTLIDSGVRKLLFYRGRFISKQTEKSDDMTH